MRANSTASKALRQLATERRARVVDDIGDTFRSASVHTDWLKSHQYCSSYTLPIFRGAELSAFLFFDSTERAAFTAPAGALKAMGGVARPS